MNRPLAVVALGTALALSAGCGRSSLLRGGGVATPPDDLGVSVCVGWGCVDLAGCDGASCFPGYDLGPCNGDCACDPSYPWCASDGGLDGGGPDLAGLDAGDAAIDLAGDLASPDGGADAGPDLAGDLSFSCSTPAECQDARCAGNPNCTPGVEICNNCIDDNNNGLIDCADPQCFAFPGCQPHPCDPNHVDCSDPLCACAAPQCKNTVCMPTVDFGTLPQYDGRSERGVSTVGTTDVTLTPCAPGGGGMVVTQFTVASDDTAVKLSFTQSSPDPLFVADQVFGLFRAGVGQSCAAGPVGCYDPKAAPSGSNTWVLAAGRYYLIVQAFTKQHQGSADVTLTTTPRTFPPDAGSSDGGGASDGGPFGGGDAGACGAVEICNNGVDDNCNGLIDCADPECFASPLCATSECHPDDNVGTIVVGQPGQTVSFTTQGAPSSYVVNCGGSGGNVAVEFTLAQAAGIGLDWTQSGDHLVGLFKMPPAGQACDAQPLDCLDPGGNSPQIAWGEYPAGSYLFIFKALKPGDEGPITATIYAYQNRKVELCHNGIDDDGNGLIDCADPACFTDPGCGPPPCSPDVDLGSFNVGDSRSTTVDTTNGHANETASCAQGSGRARVIQLTLAEHAGLGVNCSIGPGVPQVLALYSQAGPRDACDQNELACADPNVIPFGCNFEIPNLQAGVYYVIVEALAAGDEGPVNLTLSSIQDRALEICDNGIDDDMDGYTDCADRKCATSPHCIAQACKADASIDPMPTTGVTVDEFFDTTNMTATAKPACQAMSGGRNATVYINLPQQATLTVDWFQGFGSDHVLAVYPDIGAGLICQAAGHDDGCVPTMAAMTGTATFMSLAQGKYWLVIAADKPGTEGPISLKISAAP
ncbi:MAG TPA: hypothetical protein VE987_03670 [Polyangiaceae bacterium]|nr:hypothetical protein [Polyangiaceae bacterium]